MERTPNSQVCSECKTNPKRKELLWEKISKYINSLILATHVCLPDHIYNYIILEYSSNEERCYQVLKQAHSLNHAQLCCGKSVYRYLKNCESGREVIALLGRQYFNDGMKDGIIAHQNNFENILIVGHHYKLQKYLTLKYSDRRKDESLGAGVSQYIISHKQWMKNKNNYCIKYKDFISCKNWLNKSNDGCGIMEVLKSTEGEFFLMNGVDHARNAYLFHSEGRLTSHRPQIDFLCRVNGFNFFLNISLASKDNIREVLDGKLEAIRLIQSTYYKCLRNNVMYFAVVAHDDTVDNQVEDICKECFDCQLFVPKKTLEDPGKCLDWFMQAVINNKHTLGWKKEFYNRGCRQHDQIIDKFKHELFPRMALYDDEIPNFVSVLDDSQS